MQAQPLRPTFGAALWGLCITSAVVTGCASARHVYKGRDSGVVAIPSNNNSWPTRYRNKAEVLMAEHFPDGYEVIHEEETIVGQTTTYHEQQNTRSQKGQDGTTDVSASGLNGHVTTRDDTEYRIHYRRR